MSNQITKKENVILLHGAFPEKIEGVLIADIPLCNPNNEGNWMGWTKKRLEDTGYRVSCPVTTDVWKAPYAQWAAELDKEKINEDTILVGLSAGAYVLLRYLGESGKKVKKVILVAPGSKLLLEGRDESTIPAFEKEFYSYEVTEKLQAQIKEQVSIFVSNDWDVILRSADLYKQLLNAKIIEIENCGHFSFLIKEFPGLLEEILKS